MTDARISDALCVAHRTAMVRLAMGKGHSRMDAEDAVQGVFLRLLLTGRYDVLGGYHPAQQRAYLCRVMETHLVNLHRARMARCRGGRHVHVELDGALDVTDGDTPSHAFDRGLFNQALVAAGTSEDELIPERGALNGTQRSRLMRRKRSLRAHLQHFRS